MFVTLMFINIAIRNKENLIKKNEKYPNITPSRYAVIWAISILYIIIYSIIGVLNILLNFTEMNEFNYLSPVVIVYSFSVSALFYGVPDVKVK